LDWKSVEHVQETADVIGIGVAHYLGLARLGCIVIVLRLREMVSSQC
jgi:hypothetical protein